MEATAAQWPQERISASMPFDVGAESDDDDERERRGDAQQADPP
jgi:hypothetical protein